MQVRELKNHLLLPSVLPNVELDPRFYYKIKALMDTSNIPVITDDSSNTLYLVFISVFLYLEVSSD